MFVELDYQRQQITINRRGTEETRPLQEKAGYRTETIQETPFIQTREPLKNELQSFLNCIQTRSTPIVDGKEALKAVRLAINIANTIDSN
jgi:predicted dehydrogenase